MQQAITPLLEKELEQTFFMPVQIAENDSRIENILVSAQGPWYRVALPPFFVENLDVGDSFLAINGSIRNIDSAGRSRWLVTLLSPDATPFVLADSFKDHEDVLMNIGEICISLSFPKDVNTFEIAKKLEKGQEIGLWTFGRTR